RLECLGAVGLSGLDRLDLDVVASAARELTARTGRPLYCTLGDAGILCVDQNHAVRVPTYPVSGPIDIVGAGYSTTAGIVLALCAGSTPLEAAAFGNLIASITITQLGTTGTASPDQVMARWDQLEGANRSL